jgi:hypothetical protein
VYHWSRLLKYGAISSRSLTFSQSIFSQYRGRHKEYASGACLFVSGLSRAQPCTATIYRRRWPDRAHHVTPGFLRLFHGNIRAAHVAIVRNFFRLLSGRLRSPNHLNHFLVRVCELHIHAGMTTCENAENFIRKRLTDLIYVLKIEDHRSESVDA